MDTSIPKYDFFINLINSNDFKKLTFIISFILFTWLFREFRKNKLELDKLDFQRANEALEAYGKAISSIKKMKKNNHDNLELPYDELYSLYPYAIQEVIGIIDNFVLDPNDENLLALSNSFKEEVNRIKSLQSDSASYKFSNNIIDLISYYYKKNNFSSLILPLINSFLAIFCIGNLILFIFTLQSSNIIGKIRTIVLIISFIMHMFLVMATGDLITKKKLKNTLLSKIFALTLILILLITLIPYKLFSSIFYILYIFIYFIFIFRRTVS